MGEISETFWKDVACRGSGRIRCPFCSHERRKKNLKDMSVTVFDNRVVYHCHHCGEADKVWLQDRHETTGRGRRAVAKPLEQSEISENLGRWLETRQISADTAKRAGCSETQAYFGRIQSKAPAIAFPYYNKTRIYSHKIRSYPDKDFLCNGSPQTMFNSHMVEWTGELVIVEGEMDVLSCLEAGVENVVSVPNGAFKSSGSDAPLRFLKNHSDDLQGTKKIVIFTDADESGESMGAELARRLGRERCWQVTMPEGCKDANDILVKHGKEALKKAVEEATPWPIAGLHDAEHYTSKVMDMWSKGLGKGETTGLRDLDDFYSILPGQLTVVTGHPSNGKSEMVDQFMVHLAETKGWKFAIASFENEPQIHITKLISKYIGLPFFNGPAGRMNETQRNKGLEFVQRNFSFLFSSDSNLTSLDSILERLKVAVLRHGIRGAVIDPYNYIAKPNDMSETEWVSLMLSKVRQFAQANGIHVWFVAHPTKMQRSADGEMPVPKGNSISGSAAWWTKADMGITVHRPDPEFSTQTDVHVWKVRFGWTGRQGKSEVYFNEHANRFVAIGDIVTPKDFGGEPKNSPNEIDREPLPF